MMENAKLNEVWARSLVIETSAESFFYVVNILVALHAAVNRQKLSEKAATQPFELASVRFRCKLLD